MLDLNSPKWADLQDGYGSGEKIPALLAQLRDVKLSTSAEDEPWFSLWSALCHQGDVYPASFAAVPHIVTIATLKEGPLDFQFLQLPKAIEEVRLEKGMEIPADLRSDYENAVKELSKLVVSEPSWAK